MAEGDQPTARDALTDVADAFPGDVVERAEHLIGAYDPDADIDPREFAAAAVYLVARDRYTSEEVAAEFGVESLSNMRLRLINELGDTYYEYAATPPNIVRDRADALGEDAVDRADRLFETWDGWRRSNRSETTIAAAVAYCGKVAADPGNTSQEGVADLFGVSDEALRDVLEEIKDAITLDEFTAALYGEPKDIDDTPFKGYTQNHKFRDPDTIERFREAVEQNERPDSSPVPEYDASEDLRPDTPFVVNTVGSGRLFDVSNDSDRSRLSVNRVDEESATDTQSLVFTPDVWARIRETIRLHAQGTPPRNVKLPPQVSVNHAGDDYVVEEHGEYVRLPTQEWLDLLAPVVDMQARQRSHRHA